MVQKEMQEFELSIGEHSLLPLVAQHATIRIKPQALEFPYPPEHAPGDHRHTAQGDEARRDVERWRVAEAEPERS
jgi:hypothetical protein